jgi:hypothetical protein
VKKVKKTVPWSDCDAEKITKKNLPESPDYGDEFVFGPFKLRIADTEDRYVQVVLDEWLTEEHLAEDPDNEIYEGVDVDDVVERMDTAIDGMESYSAPSLTEVLMGVLDEFPELARYMTPEELKLIYESWSKQSEVIQRQSERTIEFCLQQDALALALVSGKHPVFGHK